MVFKLKFRVGVGSGSTFRGRVSQCWGRPPRVSGFWVPNYITKNRDLKFALVTRDQRLEDAANKVAELVEQNTYLSQKVERAAMDYTKQNDELVKIQKDFEKQCHDLNKKLAQVEEKRSLESTALDSSGMYVTKVKLIWKPALNQEFTGFPAKV